MSELAYAIWHDPTLRCFVMGDLVFDGMEPCLDPECPQWDQYGGRWVAHWHATAGGGIPVSPHPYDPPAKLAGGGEGEETGHVP